MFLPYQSGADLRLKFLAGKLQSIADVQYKLAYAVKTTESEYSHSLNASLTREINAKIMLMASCMITINTATRSNAHVLL